MNQNNLSRSHTFERIPENNFVNALRRSFNQFDNSTNHNGNNHHSHNVFSFLNI